MAIWRMRIACWVIKVTNTHSDYVILIDFHCNNGYTKAAHCYVLRTVPVLLVTALAVHETTYWVP